MATPKQVFTKGKPLRNQVRELTDIRGLRSLRDCEDQIERSLDTAWHALREIHDRQLYVDEGYGSFKAYCEKRWGYSKSRAHQLIDYTKIVDHLKANGVEFLPSGEGQVRPIMKLRRKSKNEEDFLDRAAEAWQIATDTAPKKQDVPQVTGDHVESTMAHFGIYGRKSAPKPNAVREELKSALYKLASCQAMKMSGHDFVEQHGSGAFPKGFHGLVDWLTECAEVADAD
jgi:hypothetical protein